MGKYYILFNPTSCNGEGENSAHRLDQMRLDGELCYLNMPEIEDLDEFIVSTEADASIVLCGGDGTLNFFINHTDNNNYTRDIYYFPCGTGNDFYKDVDNNNEENIIKINQYLSNLPTVEVKGQKYYFLNNVGFGIDGYCCEVGDAMRAQHKENINYTAIAIKGLLGGFKPVTATVTIDGETEVFKKAWLAPTMNGRYYGGGMCATPDQKRLREDGKLSVMLFYGHGKFKTLAAFPSIFQGEHIKHKNMVRIMEGRDITVSFSRPCALQIDGETIPNVTEYTAHSGKRG